MARTAKKPKSARATGSKAVRSRATDARSRRPSPKPVDPLADDRFGDITEPERSAPALAEVDHEVLEFIEAVDRFKKQHGRPFPSWSEVLLIVRQLGYRRA